MSVFKQLEGGSYIVEPFEGNASQSFEWTSGSSDIDGFSINFALQPPDGYPIGTSDLGGLTNGGFYSYPLYQSILKYFYVDGEPISGEDTSSVEYFPSGSMYVWNIGSGHTGDGIKPKSFRVQLSGSSSFVVDDGNRNLRVNSSGSIIGTVFYEHGIAVIGQDESLSSTAISEDGIYISAGDEVETTFLSVINIYEHTVNCKLSPTDYQYTFNPSAFDTGSDGITYNNRIQSGSVAPYITTIGLYNNFNELLAVGKLSKPITRLSYTDQTFIIKFDDHRG